MKKLFLGLLLVSLAGVTACASHLNANSDNKFNLLSLNGDVQPEHFGDFKADLFSFLKDLNLTSAQKDSFKDLRKGMKANFENNKDNREKLKDAVKTAFLSDSIDKNSLKASIETLKPKYNEHIDLMSGNIIKAYNILTPAQRVVVENKLNQIQDKVGKFISDPNAKGPFGGVEKRLEMMKKNLNLTDDQVTKIKDLFNEGKPDRTEIFETAKKVRADIQAELKSNSPDQEKIKEILKGVRDKMESKMDAHLDKMIKVHDLLTPDQRKTLVSHIEGRHNFIFDKIKAHFSHNS